MADYNSYNMQNTVNVAQVSLKYSAAHKPSQLSTLQELHSTIYTFKQSLANALEINSFLVQQIQALNQLQELTAMRRSEQRQRQENDRKEVNIKIQQQQQNSDIELAQRKKRVSLRKTKNEDKDQQSTHDKNQTKNIPKNYGKAILSFIQKNIQKHISIIKPILQKSKLTINDLLLHIKKHKRQVNSINYLKEMWGYEDKGNPIFKCIRILSYIFMRKHCLSYIFNSRVKNYSTHIKYRKRIIQGIQHPQEFTCIKQF